MCVYSILYVKPKSGFAAFSIIKANPAIDGPTKIRVVTGTPIFDEQGHIKYVISVMQDVQSFESLVQSLLTQNKMLTVRDPQTVEKAEIIAKVRKSNS